MDLIDVGYARRAHGIGGEIVVRPLTDDPGRWVEGATVFTDESTSRTLEVVAIRPHRGDLLVRFQDITDRDAAEALRGVRFQIPASLRRTLGDDEYWPDDLVGCTVLGPEGEALGTVAGVEFGGAQDRIVVETVDGSRVEVPFVEAIVPMVDLEAGVITVTPPAGLFPE